MFARTSVAFAALAGFGAIVAHTSGGAGPERVYTVKPGDTLWSIAARHYAGDPRAGIWQLRRRNHLAGSTIHLGERLVLP
jgi:LysM repeat protein